MVKKIGDGGYFREKTPVAHNFLKQFGSATAFWSIFLWQPSLGADRVGGGSPVGAHPSPAQFFFHISGSFLRSPGSTTALWSFFLGL